MRTTKSAPKSSISVRLQINTDKLLQLVETGSICATDFSCLDHQSKDTIKRLFLQACSKELAE